MTHDEFPNLPISPDYVGYSIGHTQMTHDELLAKINGKGSADFATLKYNPEGQKDIQDVFKALLAVVELHKPNKTGGCSAEYIECHSRSGLSCDEDCNTYVVYPCRTIQAIERELG